MSQEFIGLAYAIGVVLDAVCILLFFGMLIENSKASIPDVRINALGFVTAVSLLILKMTHLIAYPNFAGLESGIQFRLSIILILNYAVGLIMVIAWVRYEARMNAIYKMNLAAGHHYEPSASV